MVEELSVSLVAEVCGTCAHWLHAPGLILGTCDVISEDDSDDGPAHIDTLSDSAQLQTRATFGCTLWASNRIESGKPAS